MTWAARPRQERRVGQLTTKCPKLRAPTAFGGKRPAAVGTLDGTQKERPRRTLPTRGSGLRVLAWVVVPCYVAQLAWLTVTAFDPSLAEAAPAWAGALAEPGSLLAMGLLDDHLRHCVRDAISQGPDAMDDKLDEASQAIARLVKS